MECDDEEEEIIQPPLASNTTEEKLNYLVVSMAKVQDDNKNLRKKGRSAEGIINAPRKMIFLKFLNQQFEEFLQTENLNLWHLVNHLRYDVRLLETTPDATIWLYMVFLIQKQLKRQLELLRL